MLQSELHRCTTLTYGLIPHIVRITTPGLGVSDHTPKSPRLNIILMQKQKNLNNNEIKFGLAKITKVISKCSDPLLKTIREDKT